MKARDALCCANCFNQEHRRLIEFITANGMPGETCGFCNSTDISGISPDELRPLFEPLLEMYRPVEYGENMLPDDDPAHSGDTLALLLNDDFDIISEAAIERADDLIGAVFERHHHREEVIDTEGLWCHREQSFAERSTCDVWWTFCHHLKHERRFILDKTDHELVDPLEWLPDVLAKLAKRLDHGSILYRGRTEHHKTEEMGAPSREKATPGRANPRGIPYLYLATDAQTVVAELRPWRGLCLSIAEFALARDLRVVDLSETPRILSPFEHLDEDLYALTDKHKFMRHLSDELSHPVDPEKADLDYLPTQYLTEVVKHLGYDGLIYRSAVGPGRNAVVFSPANAVVERVTYATVTGIEYSYRNDRSVGR